MNFPGTWALWEPQQFTDSLTMPARQA